MRATPGFLIASLVLAVTLHATPPRCAYPDCFPGGNGIVHSYVFSTVKSRLAFHELGTLDDARLVLLESSELGLESDKKLVRGFLVKDQNGAWKFEPFGSKDRAYNIALDGEPEKARTVEVSAQAGEKTKLKLDPAASLKVKGPETIRAWHQQEALDALASQMDIELAYLKKEVSAINFACETEVTLSLNDGYFREAIAKMKPADGDRIQLQIEDIQYRCEEIIAPLKDAVCANAEGKTQVQKRLKKVVCGYSSRPRSRLRLTKDGLLEVTTSLTQVRDGKNSFNAPEALKKIFLTSSRQGASK